VKGCRSGEDIATGREREHAGEAVAVEHEGRGGDARRIGSEAGVEITLDALIHRAEVLGQQPVLLAAEGDESAGELIKSGTVIERVGRAAEVAQTQVDVEQEQALFFRRGDGAQADLAQLGRSELAVHDKRETGETAPASIADAIPPIVAVKDFSTARNPPYVMPASAHAHTPSP
jgi:hypothetical protein